MNAPHRSAWAADVLLPDGWARQVLLRWDASGVLAEVATGVSRPTGVRAFSGPVIPGLPNLHSHAFQRGFAGLTETATGASGEASDSFWSWREMMYRFASRIDPEQVEAIATWLYAEMLAAGYTSVCEFHYLHHQPDGRPYAPPDLLAQALMRAAERTGIGMTLLPVLYQASGFGGQPPVGGQQRFINATDQLLAMLASLQPVAAAQGARIGLALHSLRAVPPDALRAAITGLDAIDVSAPIHIHVAEQIREVEECLSWSGLRPVEWLLSTVGLGPRWCLVHATHMNAAEAAAAAATGAVAGLCPSTEANLGDGVFDMGAWRQHGGVWGLGSDSHVTVNAAEEMMLLEYSQRGLTLRRNCLTSSAHREVATAMVLAALAGGARASGRAVAGLAVGQKADFVVLDSGHLALQGLSAPDALSAHVFASHRSSAIAEVWTAGRCRVTQQRHVLHEEAAAAFVAARKSLLHR